MAKFRFQDLEIWKMAIEIADELFEIADKLEKKSYFDLLTNYEAQEWVCQIILQKDQAQDSTKHSSDILIMQRVQPLKMLIL
ncbi:MAG TPA: hypothetical protein VF181_06810 [Balneolaceae bacterium]